jgi:hypothetical protein
LRATVVNCTAVRRGGPANLIVTLRYYNLASRILLLHRLTRSNVLSQTGDISNRRHLRVSNVGLLTTVDGAGYQHV